MSLRNDVLTALAAAIQALATGVADASVVEYEGEAELFNAAATHPLIAYAYQGVQFGDDLERGATTHERVLRLSLYVCAQTTASSDGPETARDVLEVLEVGLADTDLTAGTETVRLSLAGEQLVGVQLGRYVYEQIYTATHLYSSA